MTGRIALQKGVANAYNDLSNPAKSSVAALYQALWTDVSLKIDLVTGKNNPGAHFDDLQNVVLTADSRVAIPIVGLRRFDIFLFSTSLRQIHPDIGAFSDGDRVVITVPLTSATDVVRSVSPPGTAFGDTLVILVAVVFIWILLHKVIGWPMLATFASST